MAAYIYLATGRVDVNSADDISLVLTCIKDFQDSLGLVAKVDGRGVTLYRDHPAGFSVDSKLGELNAEVIYGVPAPNSPEKWHTVISSLRAYLSAVPHPPEGNERYVLNPLFTDHPVKLRDWQFRMHDIYHVPSGLSIPKRWVYVLTSDMIRRYMQAGSFSPSQGKEEANFQSSLSELAMALEKLNSRSSKDRAEEISRKLDGIAKIGRVMMEECESK